MQGKKAGCDNVAKYASNLAEYRGPLPPPPLNLQLDQAGNHNEDGPPFRSSIYCLLQAHDIALLDVYLSSYAQHSSVL